MALYVSTALLLVNLLSTESQLSSESMFSNGVLKSTLKMILAARFCSLSSRSRVKGDVDP